MSPIATLQAQWRELGRIRIGQQVEFTKADGKKGLRPDKLGTFRLTSPHRDSLERAAAFYGGEVTAWPEAPDGEEWQLVTTTDALDIIVPPGDPISQWNEMWSGGGCVRRCDGIRNVLTLGSCLCPADPAERNALAGRGEACKPTTRLQVILPRLPDIGTWLLVSHGYYAASELKGTVNLLRVAAEAGRMTPAQLWIDQRHVSRPGQKRRDFGVPAIRILESMAQLQAPAVPGEARDVPLALSPGRPQLPSMPALPEQPAFAALPAPRPVSQALAPVASEAHPEGPTASVESGAAAPVVIVHPGPAPTPAINAGPRQVCGEPSPHTAGQFCTEAPHGPNTNHRSPNRESWANRRKS